MSRGHVSWQCRNEKEASAISCLMLFHLGPAGFEAEVQKANGGNAGPPVLMQQASERALLTGLLARLRTLDPDAIVGHNLTAFDLDVLLHRLQAHKVRAGADLYHLTVFELIAAVVWASPNM